MSYVTVENSPLRLYGRDSIRIFFDIVTSNYAISTQQTPLIWLYRDGRNCNAYLSLPGAGITPQVSDNEESLTYSEIRAPKNAKYL